MMPGGARRAPRPLLIATLSATLLLASLLGAGPALAEGVSASWWHLSSSTIPTHLAPGKEGTVVVTASNLGDTNVKGSEAHPIVVSAKLPAGLTVTGVAPAGCAKETGTMKVEKIPMCGERWPRHNSDESEQNAKDHKLVTCTVAAGNSGGSCTFPKALSPYETIEVAISVAVAPNAAESPQVDEAKVEGGEAPGGGELPAASLNRALAVTGEPVPFGIENYELGSEGELGAPATQAGSHPFQLTTSLALNKIYYQFENGSGAGPEASTPELAKNIHVNLPPGFIGNPNTNKLPKCTALQFATILHNKLSSACPAATAVGAAIVTLNEPRVHAKLTLVAPVFNIVPAPGEPARFGMTPLGVPITLDTVVNGGDYHVVVSVSNISQDPALLSSLVTIWGVPHDPRHDISRGTACLAIGPETRGADAEPSEECKALGDAQPAPFLTLPTSCNEPLQTTVEGQSWSAGAGFLGGLAPAFTGKETGTETPTGCNQLPFTPAISVKPTEQQAGSPTGLKVILKVPQGSLAEEHGLAEADIRNTVVKLPVGMQLSPSAADGLQACSSTAVGLKPHANEQTGTIEFFNEIAKQETEEEEAGREARGEVCPKASKVGTVRIKTPLLEQQLQGNVYLAAQEDNPFHSLFGIYIVVKDPVSGTVAKLAGEVKLDETTGQVTSVFPNAPQLPFEELALELDEGPRASLATPRACGSYASQAAFTPWSGTAAVESFEHPADLEFSLGSGPEGTACPAGGIQPFNPGFAAGTTNPQAGAFTPFTLSLTRGGTDQQPTSLSMTLPPGIAGLLSQVKQCPEPQASQGTCGPESLIGSATAYAGLGSDPFKETGGRVYITGPYHGAPFGLSIVIPAKAGPFDFGQVVTRSTISVDPNTAALTINSELPTMLNTTTHHTGVPVQLRRVDVTVERPGGAPFQFNPTNCTRTSITGVLTGDQGASTPVSSPFQATGCDKLAFSPKLSAEVDSKWTKQNGTSLKVKVEATPGQANIQKTKITFPLQLPSRLSTIQKACLDAVFKANPANCPEGSLIGSAIAHTPVLNSPLAGPAYLVSHGGGAFPDAEFVLQGEGITLILDGQTNIHNGITSSTFSSVPDAPISTFEVTLPAGPHSAFTGFEDLCKPVVMVSKKVLVKKKVGKRTVKVRKTVTTAVAAPLSMPTILGGQNGDVIEKTTPLKVTGCQAVKSFKKAKAPKKKPKKKKSTKKGKKK
jgi:hypothetical protein